MIPSPEEIIAYVDGRLLWHRRRGLSVPESDFDDLRADLIRAAWLVMRRFEPSRGVKWTTFATARIDGEVVNWLRLRTGHRRRHPTPKVWFLSDDITDQACGPMEEAAAADDLRYLRALIERLPESDAQVMRGRYRGKTFAKIADERGYTESMACKVAKRGLGMLRQLAGVAG